MRASARVCVVFSLAACAAAPAQNGAGETMSSRTDVGTVTQITPATKASVVVNAVVPAVAQPKKFESPEAMLSALEKAGDTISTFRANVIYDRVDAISENRERRTGQIVLAQKAGQLNSRKLALVFDQLIDASGHATTERQRFVFSGGWLFEFDDQRHQLIARQLVAPGEQLDPLRIGEGPIPIPIGQKKIEVLQRFDVSFTGEPTQPMLKRLDNIQGLALHPKQNAGVDPDLGDICVWYDLATLMPAAVTAMTKGGDQKILLLTQMQVNQALPDSATSVLSTQPPAATPGGVAWRTDVRPYKAAP